MGFLSLVPLGYRLIALALLVVTIFGYGWFRGNEHGTAKLTEYVGKQAAEAVRIVTKRGQVTERVVTTYIEVEAKTANVNKTVEQEVAKYAAKNRTFTLDTEWRSLHNRAALGSVPGAAGEADAAGGAPTAAEALATVTANYGACNRTADRLDGLQAWVREQAKVR